MGAGILVRDEVRHGRSVGELLEPPGLRVEPADRAHLLVVVELRLRHRRFQHADRLVVDAERHRKRVPVLAAMGKREAGWIGEAAGRAVDHLGDHCQRLHRALADARDEQQLGEILGRAVGGGGERAVQAAKHDVAGADVVMRRHDEMRQQRLVRGGRRRLRIDCGELAGDAIGTDPHEQVKLGAAGRCGAAVGQVDDPSLPGAVDGGMRRLDEGGQSFRQPVVASGGAGIVLHALLDHDPLAVVGDDEAVQVELEAVLDRGAVDLGDKAAGAGEGGTVEADAVAHRHQLIGGFPRMPAPAAADMQAELAGERSQAALQRADDAGGDAGGVPVHPHHRAEGLEPERMCQAAQQLVAAIFEGDRLGDHGSEPRHPLAEPARNTAAVQRQVGSAGSVAHASRPYMPEVCGIAWNE